MVFFNPLLQHNKSKNPEPVTDQSVNRFLENYYKTDLPNFKNIVF